MKLVEIKKILISFHFISSVVFAKDNIDKSSFPNDLKGVEEFKDLRKASSEIFKASVEQEEASPSPKTNTSSKFSKSSFPNSRIFRVLRESLQSKPANQNPDYLERTPPVPKAKFLSKSNKRKPKIEIIDSESSNEDDFFSFEAKPKSPVNRSRYKNKDLASSYPEPPPYQRPPSDPAPYQSTTLDPPPYQSPAPNPSPYQSPPPDAVSYQPPAPEPPPYGMPAPEPEPEARHGICNDPLDREDILVKYLQNGLPQQAENKSCRKHVIIVGAGISGLMAGKLLKLAGHKVTILESTDRVGGRIQTYRDLENKWQNEFGPMRIPKMHGLTRELISQFDLKLAVFENDPIAFFVENRRIGYKAYARSNAQEEVMRYIFQKFNVDQTKEMVTASQLIAEALSEPLADFGKLTWKQLLKKYDKYSVKHWLAHYANVSEASIGLAAIFYNIEPWIDNGLIEILIDDCVYGGDGGFDYIVGGFDQLPKGFLKDLSEDIHYHSKVTDIIQTKNNHVYVKTTCKGITCEEKFLYKGDYAIVTTSAPVASTIDYDPPLSAKKKLAHRTAKYTAGTKVLLAFETPFWEREHKKAKGGATLTDLHVRQVYYPQKGMNPNSTLHILVASYTWGQNAERYDGMNDEDAIHECLQDVAKIHKRSFEFVKRQLRNGIVKRWSRDENTLGGFAMFTPYQYIELEDVLKQREGLISFSGEHTATPHGWINSAIKSGIRAALEIHKSPCYY